MASRCGGNCRRSLCEHQVWQTSDKRSAKLGDKVSDSEVRREDERHEKGDRMNAEQMLEKVQDLKEQVLLNGFRKTVDVDEFFNEYWMQILDMLDDALYAHVNGKI